MIFKSYRLYYSLYTIEETQDTDGRRTSPIDLEQSSSSRSQLVVGSQYIAEETVRRQLASRFEQRLLETSSLLYGQAVVLEAIK